VPVLVLTARDALTDKVEHFEAGADDYLTKLSVRMKRPSFSELPRCQSASGHGSTLCLRIWRRLNKAGRLCSRA